MSPATSVHHVAPVDSITPVLDLGPQPLTNRFLVDPGHAEDRFPLALGVSNRSGLIRQLHPAPPEAVRARYSWIKYNEAEDHLDDLVARLVALPGVSPSSRVLGITYKDDSTVRRLSDRGLRHARRLHHVEDLGCREENAGLETIQQRLTADWARSFVARQGTADIVVARHILEHAHRPREFLAALRMLVRPGGHLVLEVPDSATFLDACDYTMPWEEHICYFTPAVFRRFLEVAHLQVDFFRTYPYALENSLVAVLRNAPAAAVPVPGDADIDGEIRRVQRYAEGFAPLRARTRAWLERYRREQGRIALLGAGHLACAFVNFLGLDDLIEFIADDATEKHGLFFPGSRRPIKPSRHLLEDGIKLCLLSVNHNAEDRVIARNEAFVRAGNEFRSIFRTSPRCLPL